MLSFNPPKKVIIFNFYAKLRQLAELANFSCRIQIF